MPSAARLRVATGLGALALLAALSWRCSASKDGAATPNAPAAAPAGAAKPAAGVPHDNASAPRSALVDETAAASAAPQAVPPAPAGSANAPPAASVGNPGTSAIIGAVAQRDPRDLALLARIERELKRDPPASVHALIRLREGGASRSLLMTRAAELPANDVALRVVVQRWIDEVAPDPARMASPAPNPSGSARPLVRPIERATP